MPLYETTAISNVAGVSGVGPLGNSGSVPLSFPSDWFTPSTSAANIWISQTPATSSVRYGDLRYNALPTGASSTPFPDTWIAGDQHTDNPFSQGGGVSGFIHSTRAVPQGDGGVLELLNANIAVMQKLVQDAKNELEAMRQVVYEMPPLARQAFYIELQEIEDRQRMLALNADNYSEEEFKE